MAPVRRMQTHRPRSRPPTATLAQLAVAALLLAACGYPPPPESGPVATVQETTPTPKPGAFSFDQGSDKTPITFPDGLKIVDIQVGSGPPVPKGATVNVDYTGWLSNGKQFDSSLDRGRPLCAILASNAQSQGGCTSVIQGWNEGIPGMRVGGVRKLIIPPSLGYGSQAQGPIPANSTLVFIVKVESIVSTTPPSPSAGPTG